MCKLLTFALMLTATSLTWANNATDTARVIELGKSQNQTFKHLTTFTSKFGPRLTGSPNLAKAQDWAVGQFQKWGLSNVHKEKWGDVPVGFYRGSRQTVKMTSPWPTTFEFTTLCWTPGTKGKIHVSPILEPETIEEFNKIKDSIKGKWIVMRNPAGMRVESTDATEIGKLLDASQIAGRIYGATAELVHTSGKFTGLEWDKLPQKASVRIRRSDYRTLVAGMKRGNCELEMDIENHFVKGPVPQFNVIAEIPGTEKPDEVVIVCGHFDSWNGPGSVGANDNGTGSTVTLEAARMLKNAGVKPKRTIRFILWSGEEQGLLGSRAYVEAHKEEMSKISAVFNDDGGTNYQGGYSCLAGMDGPLNEAIAPIIAAFPTMPMSVDVVPSFSRRGSSDHASFIPFGVPAFFTKETGKADYGFVWHTQHDRPEFSVPEYLMQSSTNAAVVALYFANANELLMRVPPAQAAGIPGAPVGGAENTGADEHDHDHND